MKLGWLPDRKYLLLFVAALIAVIGLSTHFPIQEWLTATDRWLQSIGFWSVPAFVALYVLISILGLPNLVLMLIAGTLFGLGGGILLVSLADTLSAIACYGVGRTVARKRMKIWMQQKPILAQLDHAVARKGWRILLLSRLSPVIPSSLLNYGFSCTRVNFWQYLFFTWLGMLPVISFYIYVGYFGNNLIGGNNKPGSLILQIIGIVATIAVAIYTTRLVKSILSSSDKTDRDTQPS